MEKKQYMSFRLDDNVVIALLATSVLASLAFVVRYTNYTPCKSFEINTLSDRVFTGTLVRFEATISGRKNYEWDFGDNQGSTTEVSSVVHSFDRPGEYLIALKVDDRCIESRTLFVQQAAEISDSSQMPRAIIPMVTEVGKPTKFYDSTANASAWEWRFGENENVDAYVKNPEYVFRQPGWKTITLTVNGNNKSILVKKIFVNPPQSIELPPQARQTRAFVPRAGINQRPQTRPLDQQLYPTPAPPAQPQPQPAAPPVIEKAPDISIGDLKQLFYGVADGNKTAASFTKYLCDGNLNTYTNVNGKASTLNEFCAKLATLKKSSNIKKLTVTPKKNQETNCIISMDVVVIKKSGIFGISTANF